MGSEQDPQAATEFAQVITRLNQIQSQCFAQDQKPAQQQLELVREKLVMCEEAREALSAEIQDLKENHTVDAYFRKLKHCPDEKTRQELLS